ncbi:MAG: hypothetical protein JXX14_12840 [Deltaproteobacteria bacterium]|nr:hypothetical protein [Deltaproteobacteria bacterium]
MIQDNKDIYNRYLILFKEKFGDVEFGAPVRSDGYIVQKMTVEEFDAAFTELRRTEQFLRETMSRGNTLSDAVERQYRELAAQVLEKPKDFKIL